LSFRSSCTTLAEVAKDSNADVQELRKLNPHLKKGRVPSDSAYPVTLPRDAARTFASARAFTGSGATALIEE
jgi:hypothetical protein